MKKLKFTKTERRAIIFLMLLNLFALTVNYFSLSPKIETRGTYSTLECYIFTDAADKPYNGQYEISISPHSPNTNYRYHHNKEFWPFLKFNVDGYKKEKFRGLFPAFDHTEFLVYSALIFGIPLLRKIW